METTEMDKIQIELQNNLYKIMVTTKTRQNTIVAYEILTATYLVRIDQVKLWNIIIIEQFPYYHMHQKYN